MLSFNNSYANKIRKILLRRVYFKAIVTNNSKTETSATVNTFLLQCIVSTFLLPRKGEKHSFGECILKH